MRSLLGGSIYYLLGINRLIYLFFPLKTLHGILAAIIHIFLLHYVRDLQFDYTSYVRLPFLIQVTQTDHYLSDPQELTSQW